MPKGRRATWTSGLEKAFTSWQVTPAAVQRDFLTFTSTSTIEADEFVLISDLPPAQMQQAAQAYAGLKAMFGDKEKWVVLKKHIPVHLMYFTLRVDDDGTIRSYGDVYGHNKKLIQLLNA